MPDVTTSNPKPILAVTGSQRPYIFDLPHLLSLPKGFEFRFRYRHQWVQDELADSPASLVGREMIVLFHSQESRYILPIRRCTIIGIEKLGPMILLRFRVGEFSKIELDLGKYTYPPDNPATEPNPAVTAAVSALIERAKALLGPISDNRDWAKQLDDGWYLHEAQAASPPDEWDKGMGDDAAASWAKIVAILHGDLNLIGLPFFYLLGFRTESGATVGPSVVENRFSEMVAGGTDAEVGVVRRWLRGTREPIYGFRLRELDRYRMRVLEWCEPPKSAPHPRVQLNCDFHEAHLALEGASNLVVGRYDVVEFTFSAQQPGYSEVGLRADSLDKEDLPQQAAVNTDPPAGNPQIACAHWPTIFAVRVPVVVKPKPRKFITAAVVGAIGLGLYIWLAPKIGPEHSTWRRVLEVAALAILFLGWRPFAQHLERFLKLSGGLHKLRGGITDWTKKGDD